MRTRQARSLLARVLGDGAGASAVEFALATPMLIVVVFGTLELAQTYYLRTVLQGEVSAAGRNSSVQNAASSQTVIDNRVSRLVHYVMPKATVTFSRRNYVEFTDVGDPENFTDGNGNGRRDAGECFVDMNSNNTWDADLGKSGQGGANDVVVYTVKVTFRPMFGFGAYFGLPASQTINATTVMKNQPYATQTTRTGVQVCT